MREALGGSDVGEANDRASARRGSFGSGISEADDPAVGLLNPRATGLSLRARQGGWEVGMGRMERWKEKKSGFGGGTGTVRQWVEFM